MQVTLGGDRLGSGNKNKIALRNYERSTHDLSQKFTSSMQVGTLYPFLVLPAMRGDKFTIDLAADARTIPTKGPLFGSFKMQVDLFQCDVRLYQAILHNNPLAIGMKMSQVKFPVMNIQEGRDNKGFSNTSLLKYLGISGIGTPDNGEPTRMVRKFNAIPALAYYEIFKTYYSNKQEENAYLIGTQTDIGQIDAFNLYNAKTEDAIAYNELYSWNSESGYTIEIDTGNQPPEGWQSKFRVNFYYVSGETSYLIVGSDLKQMLERGQAKEIAYHTYRIISYGVPPSTYIPNNIKFTYFPTDMYYEYKHQGLQPFKLANIDAMRLKLLSHHQLGTPFIIDATLNGEGYWGTLDGEDNGLPYINLVKYSSDGSTEYSMNATSMNGLVVKTYQSDLYNNWVNTEWIDGENGIANVTAISTASGKIQIDTINLSEKLYNMLNRIAVSDGSYEGWQDAVYTETPKRHIESPVYLGGMSSEIVFEEIVQTSQGDATSPLGTLGGKGKLLKRKGGHVTVKCNEACFIIGIVSLTPRINYTQGNEFYMTDLFSMDDLHKPALDGIGFQNLIGERLAWWDTKIDHSVPGIIASRSTIGKLPAWIEYMTAVDKCYGDFAEPDGMGFMNLLRQYDRTSDNEIGDATTYIDPRKYNYAFANTAIDAQNFWVQIYSHITARRLMSAKQIPNL